MRKLLAAIAACGCAVALTVGAGSLAWAEEPSAAAGGLSYSGTYYGGKWDSLLPGFDYEAGEFILWFEPGVEKEAAEQAVHSLGWRVKPNGSSFSGNQASITAYWPDTMNMYQAEFQAYSQLPIVSVELNYIFQIPEGPTNKRWSRFAGKDALQTMLFISRNDYGGFWEKGKTVVLTTLEGYWDALSASAVAGANGAPIILTDSDELSFEARSELARLNPTKVIIAGGEEAISRRVAAQVHVSLDARIIRISGVDAQGTSRAFCKQLDVQGGEAIVASSSTYHDALSIAPFAYAHQVPVLLADADGRLSAETLALIEEKGFENVVVVGGPAAVSPDVESQLGNRFAERVFGETAVDTSAAIAKWETERGMEVSKHMGVATANGWQDALAGAALCGQHNCILVLASPEQMQAVDWVLDQFGGDAEGYVFGGTAAVPDSILKRLQS